jgi:two-component system chemotaxis response regulator CheY
LKTEDSVFLSANVLVVDDDPAILRLLSHLLEQGGHKVRMATDGNQCLQMVLQECPDVLITDWIMPGLDGLEVCRRVRQLYNRKVLSHYTYILLLTAQTGRNFFIEGLEAGADDFVEKSTQSLFDLRIEIKARLKAALRIRKLETDLEFAAKYDLLTSLLNRLSFFESAHVLWERSIKNKFPLASVMFDCDFFKRVNDIHGHAAGDAVLKEMAVVLKGFSRQSDLICRYGGEEFCVLLPGCDEKTAWNWAERIRQQFETHPIKHDNLEIGITASFGIAERLDDTLELDQLIERSDQALLFAKESGRNRCVCFSELLEVESGVKVSGTRQLFDGVTAAEVLTPFTLTVNPQETVASVMDFFLETRIEQLPVVDSNGDLIGTVSERLFVPLIGNLAEWKDPIANLVSKTVISYPVETPLRTIYDFFCRVSIRQILIMDDKKPVGFINRTQMLRWLRNRWAVSCGTSEFSDIIPASATRELPFKNLHESVNSLIAALTDLDGMVDGDRLPNGVDRMRLVSEISQSQDVMDQVLKYSTAGEDNTTGNLAQFSFV